jgi:hypothetical protein
MSWSVQFIGKPENVVAALDKHSESLTGQSKQEFDEAKPALATIVQQNVGGPLVHVEANGHATFSDGTKTFASCSVKVSPIYVSVV